MLEKLILSAKKFIFKMDIYILKLTGDYDYFNGKNFDLFITEVENDIKCLNFLLELPRFERENNPLFYLIEKYKSSYCPSTFYKYFSDENKLYYCYKRVNIDDLISQINS